MKNKEKIKTNLEKKTEQKISKMTNNESLTMDFILKNRKVLQHIKHCRVMIPKGEKNKPVKRLRVKPQKKNTTKENSSSTSKKSTTTPSDKTPEKKTIPATSKKSSSSTKTPALPSKPSPELVDRNNKQKRAKGSQSPIETKTTDKPVRIFIKLPTINKHGKIVKNVNEMKNANVKKSSNKKKSKALGKTYLKEIFGNRVFCCEVRVKRLQTADNKIRKKNRANRKTVSFVETVEVFGDSGTEYESEEEEPPPIMSTPVGIDTTKRVTRRSLNGEKKNRRRGRISIAKCKTGSDEERSILEDTTGEYKDAKENSVNDQTLDDESIIIDDSKDTTVAEDQLNEDNPQINSIENNVSVSNKTADHNVSDDEGIEKSSIESIVDDSMEANNIISSPVRNGNSDDSNGNDEIKLEDSTLSLSECNINNADENIEEKRTQQNGHDNSSNNIEQNNTTINLPNSTNSSIIPNSDKPNTKSNVENSDNKEIDNTDLVLSGVTNIEDDNIDNSNNDKDSPLGDASFSLNTFFKAIKNKILPTTPPPPPPTTTKLNSSSI